MDKVPFTRRTAPKSTKSGPIPFNLQSSASPWPLTLILSNVRRVQVSTGAHVQRQQHKKKNRTVRAVFQLKIADGTAVHATTLTSVLYSDRGV